MSDSTTSRQKKVLIDHVNRLAPSLMKDWKYQDIPKNIETITFRSRLALALLRDQVAAIIVYCNWYKHLDAVILNILQAVRLHVKRIYVDDLVYKGKTSRSIAESLLKVVTAKANGGDVILPTVLIIDAYTKKLHRTQHRAIMNLIEDITEKSLQVKILYLTEDVNDCWRFQTTCYGFSVTFLSLTMPVPKAGEHISERLQHLGISDRIGNSTEYRVKDVSSMRLPGILTLRSSPSILKLISTLSMRQIILIAHIIYYQGSISKIRDASNAVFHLEEYYELHDLGLIAWKRAFLGLIEQRAYSTLLSHELGFYILMTKSFREQRNFDVIPSFMSVGAGVLVMSFWNLCEGKTVSTHLPRTPTCNDVELGIETSLIEYQVVTGKLVVKKETGESLVETDEHLRPVLNWELFKTKKPLKVEAPPDSTLRTRGAVIRDRALEQQANSRSSQM